MDTRTGVIHESAEAAEAAGAKRDDLIEVGNYKGPNRCGTCGRKVNGARPSTPKRNDSLGRPWAWCKKCWFKRGIANK